MSISSADAYPYFRTGGQRIHGQQKADLDAPVKAVACDVSIAEAKAGDLVGISVYTFRMTNQQYLLSYRVLNAGSIKLLTVGSHESFSRASFKAGRG